MNEAHREAPEMKRVGDWRPDTALLGIEAQPKCLFPINNQLDCMLHDRARANKGTIIKVPSLMHFWALLMDVADKGMDCECEKQWGPARAESALNPKGPIYQTITPAEQRAGGPLPQQ